MMIIIKLIIDAVCGVLGALGGYDFLPARRFIMPCIIGVSISFFTGVWWAGFMALPVMGTLCLGYSGTEKWWRGMWAFIQAVVIGIGLLLTGHLAWYFYVPYCILAGVIGGLYVDWWQLAGDFILYGYLSSVIWLVH